MRLNMSQKGRGKRVFYYNIAFSIARGLSFFRVVFFFSCSAGLSKTDMMSTEPILSYITLIDAKCYPPGYNDRP